MVIPIRDENPTRRRPVLTLAIIAVNVLIFFFVQPRTWAVTGNLEGAAAAQEEIAFLYERALVPCELTELDPVGINQLQTGECDVPPGPQPFAGKSVLFSVFASMFFHGGLLHLGGNMLFLWIFGNNVEDRLRPVGYLAFYLVTGVAAALTHVVLDPGSLVPVVGASGAIAGVMGAYLVWWPRARILSIIPIFFFLQFVYLPALVVLGLWFVLQFLTDPNSGVAWAAHVGGFVAGAAIAFVLGGLFRPPRRAAPDW